MTGFGFVIVFVFLLAVTRSFFTMSAKLFCIMLNSWMDLPQWNIQRMKLENTIRKYYAAVSNYVIRAKIIKKQTFSAKLLNENPVFQSFCR